MKNKKENCLHTKCEYVKVQGESDDVLMCSRCKLGIRTRGGKMLMVSLGEPKSKKCPHSNCDDDGDCFACGKNVFERAGGIIYNPRIHKQLTCDKVISIVPKGGLWKELVGVYWKGTDGASVLFETSPSKAHKIVEIFNAKETTSFAENTRKNRELDKKEGRKKLRDYTG
mgnify:CR=1 FL=1